MASIDEAWVSDAAKGFGDLLLPDFHRRLEELDLSTEKLRLFVLGRPDLVALKIVALREQDLADLEWPLQDFGEIADAPLQGFAAPRLRNSWRLGSR